MKDRSQRPSVARGLLRAARAPMRNWMTACCALFIFAQGTCPAAELKPETVAAFDHYVQVTEARMSAETAPDQFLAIDGLPASERAAAYGDLREGQIFIKPLCTRDDGRLIPIPGGLIHHWVAIIFIPNATLAETRAVLEDYDREKDNYKPNVRQSKVLSKDGNKKKIFLQFYNKSIVTAVLNVNFDVTDTEFGATRIQSASRSTRIAEVSDFGEPDEHELPVGYDHGYMWRLYSYWRIEQKDGGVYVQNESIGLSRTVPLLLTWLVSPWVKRIPRNLLSDLLIDTRAAVLKQTGFESKEVSPAFSPASSAN